MAKLDEKIGFVGGGNMAFAIASGLLNRGVITGEQIFVSGPNLNRLQRWSAMGAFCRTDNGEVVDNSDIIFLCVKPHVLGLCAAQIKSSHVPSTKDKDKLFISVLAGVKLNILENSFSFIDGLKIFRVMPNTSVQIAEGCTVFTPGSRVVQKDVEKLHFIFSAVGTAEQVREEDIEAITAMTGCGPAYVYTFLEALIDGGVKQGVPRQMATTFAAQTLLGAAKTVLLTRKHPAVLKDEVCSPGGATICGIHELEKGCFRSTVINAIENATKRTIELGKKSAEILSSKDNAQQ